MKTITHGFCSHSAPEWFGALSKALHCTGAHGTIADMEAIVDSMKKGERVWHSGILFTGRSS